MAKTKTRDLILDVALILFNDRGESAVTSVDLATEMNISPGNLYYHFKGKEEVIEELYARFHASLAVILERLSELDIQHGREVFTSLCLISEVFSEYRFISQDAINLCERYPRLRTQFSRLLSQLHRTLVGLGDKLLKQAPLENLPDASTLLADNLIAILLNHGAYDRFIRNNSPLRKNNIATPQPEATKGIERHLYIQILPFLGRSS